MDPIPTHPKDAQSPVNEFSKVVTEAVDQIGEATSGWCSQAQSCMRKHPMSSALVAVGVGALVGYLLRCRR